MRILASFLIPLVYAQLLEPFDGNAAMPAGTGAGIIKEHITWAIAGLLMLIMVGAILATINPSAYGVV